MKSILLAAGYATRLYPLTKTCPKPLLEVAGKPVLDYILAHLEKIGPLDTIYVVVNHKFISHFEKWKGRFHSEKSIVLLDDGSTHETDRLGAIGDMHFCVERQKIAEDTLVVAGDNLFDMDLAPFIQFAQGKSPFASMMVYDVKDYALAREYGIVGLDQDRRIISLEEKPKEPRSTLSAMGVYYLPKEVIGRLGEYLKVGSSHDAPGFFIRWLYQKEPVYGYPCEGSWFDIGGLDALQRASETFERRKREKRNLSIYF